MNVSANLFDTSSAALTSIILSTSTGDNFVSGSSFLSIRHQKLIRRQYDKTNTTRDQLRNRRRVNH
jgi:hypothetical protein